MLSCPHPHQHTHTHTTHTHTHTHTHSHTERFAPLHCASAINRQRAAGKRRQVGETCKRAVIPTHTQYIYSARKHIP